MNTNSTVFLTHPFDNIKVKYICRLRIPGLARSEQTFIYCRIDKLAAPVVLNKADYIYSRSWHAWINKKYAGDVLI